jgi:hypothetical protein
MARADPETLGQRVDGVPVQSTILDQAQGPLHGRPGALPRRTERRCFRAAAEARAISRTFRGCGGRIEFDVPRERGTRPTYGAAVVPRRLDRHEQNPVQSGIAPLEGLIMRVEIITAKEPRRRYAFGEDRGLRKFYLRATIAGVADRLASCIRRCRRGSTGRPATSPVLPKRERSSWSHRPWRRSSRYEAPGA